MMKKITILLLSIAAVACGKSTRVEGTLAGSADTTLYLESVAPSGRTIVDSAALKEGRFAFRVKLPQGEALYNIRSRGYTIPLALAPGERVALEARSARDYRVAGSPGSELLRELTLTLNNGAASLDSLNRLYMNTASPELSAAIAQEYLKKYYALKQRQIRFIVAHPASLAALYGLYQRLPGDATLFNGATDVVYYRLVADSLEARDAASPYLPALRSDIVRMTPIAADLVTEANFPEIELPDMYGKPARLSSLEGRVILLDFWTASSPQCRLQNAELKEHYPALHEAGLEVYQVGVDSDKALWVTTVQEQRLPWITVCDFRGTATPAVGAWNVQRLPANFLIDRNGTVVAKDLYGDALIAKIKALL